MDKNALPVVCKLPTEDFTGEDALVVDGRTRVDRPQLLRLKYDPGPGHLRFDHRRHFKSHKTFLRRSPARLDLDVNP